MSAFSSRRGYQGTTTQGSPAVPPTHEIRTRPAARTVPRHRPLVEEVSEQEQRHGLVHLEGSCRGSTAEELTSWSLSLVHGLLQTPGYAEAQLNGDKEKTEDRLARQNILTRKNPPLPGCTFLVNEGVLLREVGNPQVMREQCDHLIEAPKSLGVSLHIVKMRGEHPGNISSFTIATMEDMREVAYFECPARGFTLEAGDELAATRRALREVRALALPVDQSLDVIRKVQAER